jgi:hypothetical protein
LFAKEPSQQPNGQLQKQHNVQIQVTNNNKQYTVAIDTDKTNVHLNKYIIIIIIICFITLQNFKGVLTNTNSQ